MAQIQPEANQSAKPRGRTEKMGISAARWICPRLPVPIDPCPTPARLAVTMPESKSINASRALICRRHTNVRASIAARSASGRSTVCQTASRPAQPRECQVPEFRTSPQSCSLQLPLALVGIPDNLCVATAFAKSCTLDGGWHVDALHTTFANRGRNSAALTCQSTTCIRSRQSGRARRSLEFGTYRAFAARSSKCGHPNVRECGAGRSLLCNLFRQFTGDQAALRTFAL